MTPVMSSLATKAGFENKTEYSKSGSEKKIIHFMADDFDAPLDEFKPYTESVWLGIGQWLMDLLLAKKRSPDRKVWLETKGNLADIA